MRTLICLLVAGSISACAAGGYQEQAITGDAGKGNALAQIMAECQEQALAPEFDVIRSRVNVSLTGVDPAPFMLASKDFPTPVERLEIARWSEIRDTCSQRILALINDPPAGMSQVIWQNVVEIIQHDNQRQHELMMVLARGGMPYGQFVQESTQITARTAAAAQPFIQEAGALGQMAIAQPDEQGAAALGAFFGNLLGATLETLADAGDAGAFSGGFHHHHAGDWHGGGHVNSARKPVMKPVASNYKRSNGAATQ